MDSFSATYKQINGPFWTLAIEWQFYLLLPWLALGMGLLVRRGTTLAQRVRRLLLCLGGLMLWGILTRFVGLYFSGNPSATFLLPRPALDIVIGLFYGAQSSGLHGKFLEDFAIGMLISTGYVLAQRMPDLGSYNLGLRRLAPWACVASLLWLLLMAQWKYSQPGLLGGIYGYLGEFCFALGYGLFMAAALFGPPVLQRILGWSALRWLGVISFGIYMWHLLLLESFSDLVIKHLHGWPPLLLYSLYWGWLLICVIPWAFLLFWLIEKPWMSLRSKHERQNHDSVYASAVDAELAYRQ
jgi:peptidoglycan/LPS O-acetylase OafA/YrhL